MARSRTIKPEFFDDLILADAHALARYLYLSIWCFVDGQQLIEADPRLHKKNTWPHDDGITVDQVAGWIDELVALKRLVRLEHEGKALLYCPRLPKHSRVYDDEPKKFNVPAAVLKPLQPQNAGELRTSAKNSRRTRAYEAEAEAEAEAEEKAEALNSAGQPFDFERDIFAHYPDRPGTRKGEGLEALRIQAKDWSPTDFLNCEAAAKNYRRYCDGRAAEDPTWKPEFVSMFRTWAGSVAKPRWTEWVDWKPTPPKIVPQGVRTSRGSTPPPVKVESAEETARRLTEEEQRRLATTTPEGQQKGLAALRAAIGKTRSIPKAGAGA